MFKIVLMLMALMHSCFPSLLCVQDTWPMFYFDTITITHPSLPIIHYFSFLKSVIQDQTFAIIDTVCFPTLFF